MKTFLVLLLLLPLAGCMQSAPHEVAAWRGGIPATAMAAGGSYALPHAGGDITLRIQNGSAMVWVYDGADRMRASVALASHEGSAARLEELPGPWPVLHIVELEGNLMVESAGRPVLHVQPLGIDVQRVELINRPVEPQSGLGPLAPGPPASESVPIELGGAPTSMRLLATARFSALSVYVASVAGDALVAQDLSYWNPFLLTPSGRFQELPAFVHAPAFSNGSYVAHLRADGVDGAVLLEFTSYSRAALAAHAPLAASRQAVYEYGLVGAEPVEFEIHADAEVVTLRAHNDSALVSLFDAHDRRLGPYWVGPGALAVPVSGGLYVAVAHAGEIVLGTDVVPRDLDSMRVLEVAETVVPAKTPGAPDRYGQAETRIQVHGTPYASHAGRRADRSLDDSFVNCNDPGMVVLRQQGHGVAVAVGGFGPQPRAAAGAEDAGPFLLGTDLDVVADGFGRAHCGGRTVLVLQGYVR